MLNIKVYTHVSHFCLILGMLNIRTQVLYNISILIIFVFTYVNGLIVGYHKYNLMDEVMYAQQNKLTSNNNLSRSYLTCLSFF